MGKGLKYGEFEFPSNGVTYVRGYARGGQVGQAKVSKVMHEFGAGELHSGSKKGPVVTNRKQAVAIGMSEARKASKGKYAEGGVVNVNIPKPKDALTPKPQPQDQAPKKLLGEQMGWPKRNEIGKKSYAKGGAVERAGALAKGASKAGLEGAVRGAGLGGAVGGGLGGLASQAKRGPMLKVGGMIGRQQKLSAKSSANLPPKSMNVKSRMSAGVGSVESLNCGGKVKKYAEGGAVHPDVKEDKALIKRAVGMHDTQLHGGKHTNLSKLKRGGRVR